MLCFSFRLSAVDEITYLVACHYCLIALSSAVGLFCVLHYVANKLSLIYSLKLPFPGVQHVPFYSPFRSFKLSLIPVREHISGTYACPIFTKFYACYLWPWFGPPLVALRYVM